MRQRGPASYRSVRETRSDGVDVRFAPSEMKALAKAASEEDRSLSNLVHWVALRWLRGDLVPRTARKR